MIQGYSLRPTHRFELITAKAACFVLVIYVGWFCEVYGDRQIILYGSTMLMTGCCLVDLTRKRLAPGSIPVGVWMNFALILYAALSGLFVAANIDMLKTSLMTFGAFSLVCFVMWYLLEESDMEGWFLNMLISVAVICALQTIFRGADYYNGVIVRTMSPMNNPNTLSLYLDAGIFAVAYKNRKDLAGTLVSMALLALFVYVIILSGSRKCLLAAGILILIWAIAWIAEIVRSRNPRRIALMCILLGTAAVGGAAYFLKDYTNTTSFSRLSGLLDNVTDGSRAKLYREAWRMFTEQPLFGVGFDQFKINTNYRRGGYSHSTYAETISCMGIVGSLMYFLPMLSALFRAARMSVSAKNRYQSRLVLALCLAELFLGLGQIFYYDLQHMTLWTFIFWFVCSSKQQNEEMQTEVCKHEQ